MNKYYINSCGETCTVTADEVLWDGNGLKFKIRGEVIACFAVWNFWFLEKRNVNEVK
jgi:hypothetical protein